MKPIIHSQKHYVQISRSSVATVARNVEQLIKAVAVANKDAVDEVVEGAIVKAVYIELWVLNTGNDGSHIVTLTKNNNNDNGPNFTQMNSLGTYAEKKNVLYTQQGLDPNDATSQPVVVTKQWHKIPKSKQRFGLGDVLNLNIANNSAQGLDYCGFATYKEYL